MRNAAAFVCFVVVLPVIALAQAKDDRDERLKALEDRVRALEAVIQELKAGQGVATATPAQPIAAAPIAATPMTQAAALPALGGNTAAAKALNPDISVIGDFLGAVGRNTIRPVPGLEMHESEVGFQAILDPYAKADFFISFGEQGVNLEEGYMTFTSLPAGLVAKVGKMRAAFGRVNTTHNHTLMWTDRPMVTENLVGGEDGINDAGFSVSRILPAPKGIFLEATTQVYRGDSADVFQSSKRSDASLVGRLRGYRDLNDSTNLDLGFSYARGHNDLGSAFHTQLFGTDATVRWKPLRRAIYHSFLFTNEFIWSRRQQMTSTERAFGLFSAAEYRVNRRWTVGGRFDRSERSRDSSLLDSGFSTLLTYWPSEFSQIRGQYRFGRYAEGRDSNELRFQFIFSMGAHGAHPF